MEEAGFSFCITPTQTQMEEIVTFILAISLASERLIEFIKTVFPWLAVQHSSTDSNAEDRGAEKFRRIIIQLLSLSVGWLSAAIMVADPGELFDFFGSRKFGNFEIPAFLIGVLSSAGSVFWTQILGYSKALKDSKKVEVQQKKEQLPNTDPKG